MTVRSYVENHPASTDLPATVDGWYAKLYPLIRAIIKRKLKHMPECWQEEMLQNAIAFSWQAFHRVWKDDRAPVDAARIAAHLGAKSAKMGREFATTRQTGQTDCLDIRWMHNRDKVFFADIPGKEENHPRCSSDMTRAAKIIARMPKRLRGVAFCLSANAEMRALIRSVIGDAAMQDTRYDQLNQNEIAAYVGCSRRTVQLLIGEMRAWADCDKPTNRALAQTLADWLGE